VPVVLDTGLSLSPPDVVTGCGGPGDGAVTVWAFVVVLLFVPDTPGTQPLFGSRVTVDFHAESAETCEALRRVITRELGGFRIRHLPAGECREIRDRSVLQP
jgi:hypothetical protein